MAKAFYQELGAFNPTLEQILLYGTLPGIISDADLQSQEIDLYSYVSTYLEDEVRAEALVRNIGSFSRFLQVAAGEAGKQLNFTRLSQDLGVADTTIANYYQILEDCMLTLRIDPVSESYTKRRLVKKFMEEYSNTDLAYIVCQTPDRYKLSENIMVIPWQEIHIIFDHLNG